MKKPTLFLKKLLLLLLCFTFFSMNAQTVNTAYATQINSVFAGLDKTKVPNKLLIDYAMEFAELSAFDGTLTANNITQRGHYTTIYNTLLMARVQTGVTGLVNPTIFKANWDNLREPNKIVLSGLYYKYSKFKANASPNYVTITNNKLYDKYVNGVWQNPYEEKQVFAVAAPVLKYNGLSVDVQLPASLWYTNQSATVQSIAIDFSNGQGYQTMALGQVKNVTYTQPGLYEWKYKLTLTTGQILYSHSKIDMDGIPQSPQRTIYEPCTNTFGVDTVTFSGTRGYLGHAGKAKLQIDYAQNDCTIRKPLIVVEGFDSGLLGIENEFGEYDIVKFRNEAAFGAGDLGAQISTFDIIYVNWENGRDYLQRNAYLLEDIIKWVNEQKQAAGSNTQNVVLGQSMGGVIARYALRDMENRFAITGIAHQTSLFVSHDAPQQGANIPLSILYFARHLADQFISTPLGDMNLNPNDGAPVTIEDLQSLLNAPGTRQLLINNVNGAFNIDNTLSIAWLAEMRSLGYPQQTRNIAISNGSHCATPQDFNPGDVLFSLTGNGKTSYLTSFLIELLGPLNIINDAAFISLAILFNEPALLIGVLPGNSSFNMNFTAKALPAAGTTSEIYKGKITFTKKLFWLFNITVTLTDESFDNAPVALSYDYYPGGRYPVPFSFQNSSVDNAFISYGISAKIEDNFDFIPTASALDIGSGNVPLTNSDYFVKYNTQTPPVSPKNSPFANFTTSFTNTAGSPNQDHITFNPQTGNWLAAELDNVTSNTPNFDCTFLCYDANIYGIETLCTSATYSVALAGSAFQWSIVEGGTLATIASGNGTNAITLTPGTNPGKITLSVTVSKPDCGSRTLTKVIWVGKASLAMLTTNSGFPYSEYSLPSGCTNGNTYWEFKSASDFDHTSQIMFTYNSLVIYKPIISGKAKITAQELGMSEGQLITLKAAPINSCGSVTKVINFKLYLPTDCECGIGIGCNLNRPANTTIYKVFPNPAKDFVNIELRDQLYRPIDKSTITAELYDMLGQKRERVTIVNNIATLSVVGLKKGIYILKIKVDGQIENHQIAVE